MVRLTQDIVANHVISTDPKDMPEEFSKEEYKDRVMLVKKLKMLPYEFIIRGYMFGSMWKAYQKGEPFCGQVITGDYQLAQKLERPILTPSTKATEGHDEYSVTHEGMAKDLGEELTRQLEETCLKVYETCFAYAEQRGHPHRRHQAGVRPGRERQAGAGRRGPHPGFQPLLEQGRVPGGHLSPELRQTVPAGLADGKPPGRRHPSPELPADVVAKTREKYLECMDLLVPKKIKSALCKRAPHPAMGRSFFLLCAGVIPRSPPLPVPRRAVPLLEKPLPLLVELGRSPGSGAATFS